ncbi:MAG TPA: BadF/BadG/BcrA/BcrD ATPase family protein [Rhizomicrobium sp.]|nr:BadF/BadG/BcrA/BcrD ATPase family protein [Rhizomicrobium sp.]
MEISTRTLFIGIDGGGSGCRARLADVDGRILGHGEAGSAAVRLGVEHALAAVDAAARAALRDAGFSPDALARTHAVAGLAGIGRKSVLAELEAHRTAFASVAWFNDAIIACVGAHGDRDGGIVIAGTGSVGLALQGGREIRVGGYGFPISDEGSGADLGLRAIRSALRAHDGRIAATNLTRAVMARFGGDPFEAVAFADNATATDYAKFAPLVMDHAEAGDPVACMAVAHAAAEIESLATRLAARGVRRIALLGGLATRLTAWLSGDMQHLFVPAEGDAIDGALALARRYASEFCTRRRGGAE